LSELAKLSVSVDLGLDRFDPGTADELGGALASMDPTELVVGAMALGVFGVFAAAARFAADIVLFGEAAWAQVT
jgi:hypothetical protein